MKYFVGLISINFILSTIYSLVVEFEKFSFLNSSFTIGMIYLLFGILCFIWEKGFFNITLFSFNKMAQQINRKRGILIDENELKIEEYVYKENSFYYTSYFIMTGFIISIFTTAISFYLI